MAWHMLVLLSLSLLAPAAREWQEPPAPVQAARAQEGSAILLTEKSSVEEILDALHEAGRDLRTLHARFLLTDIDNVMLTETPRPGEVFLQTGQGGTTFRAVLEGVLVREGGQTSIRPEKVEYMLRGDELIERNYKARTQTTRRLPPEKQQQDLLKLGEGPFPLPIGQSREEVLQQFAVRELNPSNPSENELEVAAAPGSRRLRLTPLQGSPLADDFSWIEIDVSLADGMPAKVITLDRSGDTARVTELRSININVELPQSAFELERIDPGQWTMEDLRDR